MKKKFTLFTLLLMLCFSSSLLAQVSYNSFVASVMNQVSADSVYKFERQLSGIQQVHYRDLHILFLRDIILHREILKQLSIFWKDSRVSD
ncbi:MAG: hypothetical protein IPL53_14910 [Ignavibacteria bacterium]|nr:hypothetical protein [Ignavibacteria bacterium]